MQAYTTINQLICVVHQMIDNDANPQDIHDVLEEVAMRVADKAVAVPTIYRGTREILVDYLEVDTDYRWIPEN